MEKRKVLLSVKDLHVKFRVRGRILTAIRGISLDIYENESIAIVGESGSGKSVFTKTFAGMLDSNGFISNGEILFNDEELSKASLPLSSKATAIKTMAEEALLKNIPLTYGAETYGKIRALQDEKEKRGSLSEEEEARFTRELNDLVYQRTENANLKQTFDPHKEKDKIRETEALIQSLEKAIKAKQEEKRLLVDERRKSLLKDASYLKDFQEKQNALKAAYAKEISSPATEEMQSLCARIAREITLSAFQGRKRKEKALAQKLIADYTEAFREGKDVSDPNVRRHIAGKSTLFVEFQEEKDGVLYGKRVMDVSKITNPADWSLIRGRRIATVFQDPMTSLNPIITIGEQITSIILKHQDCTYGEARKRALRLMQQVGIPNAENRFDDYPFQYSGGMRQRIVIAIALSCQPEILICDEPTTALDVTIQAQILKLLKDLQKEYGFTIVFITHDLGVVANVADRVAVLYAGQIVELGTVEEVFYDPRHPYTWALLSSLPQLAERGQKLYSITGTPPSLYNKITGDAFAPRNPYCMKIDTLAEPPFFKVTDTHYAKTWLLDPRSPHVDKPAAIENIHEKLLKSLNM